MRGVVLVVAAFAAGLGLGFILQDDANVRTTRVVVEQPSGEAPRLDRARAQSLRELLEAIPIERVPSGNGTITGRVRTESDKPLAGALVLARPSRTSTRPKTPASEPSRPELDLVKLVEDRVRSARWTREGAREARTDEQGNYTITGLGESIYYLRAYAEGYTIKAKGRSRLVPGGTLDFEARPVSRVDLDITVQGAGPPDRANIRVTTSGSGGTRSRTVVWTRADPWIELNPGTMTLQAELEGELGGKSEPQTVTLKEGEAPLRLSFTVEVKPALRLLVTLPTSLARASVAGWLLRVPAERMPTAEELKEQGVHRYHYGTGDPMLWKDLEPGPYLVGAGFGLGGIPRATAVVEISSGLVEQTLELVEPSGEGVLKVRLLSSEGEPVERASWSIKHSLEGSSTSSGTSSLHRMDGVHILIDSRAAEYEGGTHTVEARSDTWGTVTAPFDPDSRAVIEMKFAKPSEPEGRISGYRGSGYEGRVRFKWERPGSRTSHAWFHGKSNVDENGRLKLQPQQPGERVLALYVSTDRNSWARIAEQTVSLQSGAQSIVIPMPALYTLRVVWSGEGKPRIGLNRQHEHGAKRISYEHRQHKVGADGTARFDGLTPGRYRVSINGSSSHKSPVVEIPTQSELRIP